MPHLSAARLFDDNRDKLQLEWIAGQSGATHEIAPERVSSSAEGLIGHLNLIHPNWIQVLGKTEIGYLQTLDDASRTQALQHLAKTHIFCLIVTGGETAPVFLRTLADSTSTPLFASPMPSVHLMWLLRYYLARALAESTVLHGVFLDVLGMGVLITGDSGVGKSELGLELISRGGSGLVADDVVELYRTAPETLEGRCPPLLKDFLEVRGLGVLDIRTIFGETSVRPRMNLKLIVHLEKPAGDGVRLERLPLAASTQTVLGVEVRKVTVPVAAGRNLAVLVEAAVRNYVLQLRGIDSTRDFIARHQQHMGMAADEVAPK